MMKEFIQVEIKNNLVFAWSSLGNHSDIFAASAAALAKNDVLSGCKAQVIPEPELSAFIAECEKQHFENMPLTEITAQRFQDMLETLPPVDWHGNTYFESFLFLEKYTGEYRSQFIRVQQNGVNRYFETMRTRLNQVTQFDVERMIAE